MKELIVAITLAFSATIAQAEDSDIVTSQAYVDTKIAEKQNAAPTNNANSVMTYDSTSDDGIGSKAIYNETSTYATQTDALLTASTANGAIQNAIDNEFTCANPPKCTLWHMTGLFPQTLPSGYTQLEYLQSTGTQYIYTGLAYDDTKHIKLIITTQFVGTLPSSGNNRALLGFGSSSGNWFGVDSNGNWTAGSGAISTITASQKTPDIEIRWRNGYQYLYIGGTYIGRRSMNTSNLTNLYLTRSGSSNYSGFRIYSAELFVDDVLRNKFIPARQDSTGALGMYDTVTNTFFTKSGSGNLIAGPMLSYIPQNQ